MDKGKITLKMKKGMIITVGTGIGADKNEAVKSLAQGIVKSIKSNNPDYIAFFVTEESKRETVPEIEKELLDLPEREEVLIKDMNDVNGVYEEVSKKLRELKEKGYDLVVDFTSGTKAMSAGAVLAATSENATISYVAGKRVGGKVVRGEEQVLSYSPVKGMVDSEIKILRELFNTYQYESCMEVIKRIEEMTSDPEITERLRRYRQLVEGYSLWDRFDHKKALEILRTFDHSIVNIERNKKILLKMERENYENYDLLIADILNNARRRMEEGKYDDAVARLYRTVELIAQYRLKMKYEIDTSNVDTWHLKTLGMERKVLEKYEELRDEKGKIKLGLKKDFELLKDLNDGLGLKFLEDEGMENLLGKRNQSILAHGLTPVKREDAEKMISKVEAYAKLVVEDLESLMRKPIFRTY